MINKEAALGNKMAIAIKRGYPSRIDWEDESLLKEALKGNEHAIKALRIDMEEKTR